MEIMGFIDEIVGSLGRERNACHASRLRKRREGTREGDSNANSSVAFEVMATLCFFTLLFTFCWASF